MRIQLTDELSALAKIKELEQWLKDHPDNQQRGKVVEDVRALKQKVEYMKTNNQRPI